MATVANFAVDQGSTFSTQINVGEGFDLTGYTARGKIRKSYSASTFTSFTTGITIFDSLVQSDFVTLTLTATQTAALKAGRYVYDVELVQGNVITRILEGQMEVLPSVSQSFSTGEGIEFKYNEENFVAHTMYHPTTGESVYIETFADHTTYMNLGYVHVYPIGGGTDSPPVRTPLGESDEEGTDNGY